MGYFCPKNTFTQLKRYIQRIYLTLLLSSCVKIHQIPCHFSNHKSFFTIQIVCIFLAQTLHTIDKSSRSKSKFSDLPLLALKFTKFISGTKSQFLFKLCITLHCHETYILCTFSSKTLYALDKRSASKCKFSNV